MGLPPGPAGVSSYLGLRACLLLACFCTAAAVVYSCVRIVIPLHSFAATTNTSNRLTISGPPSSLSLSLPPLPPSLIANSPPLRPSPPLPNTRPQSLRQFKSVCLSVCSWRLLAGPAAPLSLSNSNSSSRHSQQSTSSSPFNTTTIVHCQLKPRIAR